MTTTARLLVSLESITHETSSMLDALDDSPALSPMDQRELKRRVHGMRDQAQALIEWLATARLEEPSN